MTVAKKAARQVVAAVAAVAMLGLTACSEDSEETDSASDWQQEDPCSLLTEEEAETYLGEDASAITPKRTDEQDRPRCDWKGTGTGEVTLMLWEPPMPDVITDTSDTVKVGDTIGYITSETASSCHLDVEAHPAFVQLQARGSGGLTSDESYCDAVARTADGVLARLGW
ncbi:hypothetical protein BAY59_05880 [Prauserella coralliicola]|nr:hypothetical protein BAY59_05880 [Prauserella coralliicola]